MVYRRWASARLNDLRPWIRNWQLEGIFAGVEDVGAEDAWYSTAIHFEYYRTHNIPFSGGAADIFKCFDQVSRPLLYHIAQVAGFPPNILHAYRSFQDNVSIYNSLGTGIGSAHRRANGIPQGCPLSMMFLALLMRPWMSCMREMGASPRTLADDLLIVTTGPQHLTTFIDCTEETHVYLHSMGGQGRNG